MVESVFELAGPGKTWNALLSLEPAGLVQYLPKHCRPSVDIERSATSPNIPSTKYQIVKAIYSL